MKNKVLSLFALSVFALVVFAGAASAAGTGDIQLPSNLSQNIAVGTTSASFNVPVINTYATDYSLTWSSTISSLAFDYAGTVNQVSSLSLPTLATSSAGFTNTTSFSVSSIPTDFIGTINGTITMTATTTSSSTVVTKTIPFTINVIPPQEIISSHSTGNPGQLEVKRIDFTNNGLSPIGITFGNDNNWFPFENITAEVQVRNNGGDNINDITLNWGIWDTQSHQWVIEMNDLKSFNLKSDSTKTLTIPFRIDNKMDMDLTDLVDGQHYQFYVTATGDVDNSSDLQTSTNNLKDASIVIENNFIILNNVQTPDTVQCGSTVDITADAWNMAEDQNDVYVNVYNKDLGINQDITLGDINAFDKVPLDFTFTVPKNANEAKYPLVFTVYDENNDVYETDFNSNDAIFTVPVTVQGNCVYATAATTQVTAQLESGGSAGQPLVFTANIRNTGTKDAVYTFNVAGYSAWSELGEVTPSNVTIAAGQSQDVSVTLNVDRDAVGQKTFNFEVYSNGQLITTQPLSADITSGGITGFSLTGGSVGSITPLLIGLVTVILVVLIIIVIVKATRK
ncbi:MAG TPA: putative S-layer protein [Candidatus Omnitrophota bacterium]|nr:putative S-layer protein [Candidatus Omnitrophota bacterium]